MKRREFLKGLAAALAAAAAPTALLSSSKPAARYVVNPAWMAAKYEVMFLVSPSEPRKISHVIYERLVGENIWARVQRLGLSERCRLGERVIEEAYPPRLDHEMKFVPPMKEIA